MRRAMPVRRQHAGRTVASRGAGPAPSEGGGEGYCSGSEMTQWDIDQTTCYIYVWVYTLQRPQVMTSNHCTNARREQNEVT